jgi:hypothetical protein
MASNRPEAPSRKCLLSQEKRTSVWTTRRSENDPQPTSGKFWCCTREAAFQALSKGAPDDKMPRHGPEAT